MYRTSHFIDRSIIFKATSHFTSGCWLWPFVSCQVAHAEIWRTRSAHEHCLQQPKMPFVIYINPNARETPTVWHLPPWRLTWNIIMEVWKIISLSKWVICRFHVNLPGRMIFLDGKPNCNGFSYFHFCLEMMRWPTLTKILTNSVAKNQQPSYHKLGSDCLRK